MSRLIEQEPMMRDAEAIVDGEVFRIKMDKRDSERLKAAWERREKKLSSKSRIDAAETCLIAIAGAIVGFLMAVLISALGWLP